MRLHCPGWPGARVRSLGEFTERVGVPQTGRDPTPAGPVTEPVHTARRRGPGRPADVGDSPRGSEARPAPAVQSKPRPGRGRGPGERSARLPLETSASTGRGPRGEQTQVLDAAPPRREVTPAEAHATETADLRRHYPRSETGTDRSADTPIPSPRARRPAEAGWPATPDRRAKTAAPAKSTKAGRKSRGGPGGRSERACRSGGSTRGAR